MITAPLPRASPSGSGRLSMIIPQNHGLTFTYSTPTIQFDWSVSRAYVIGRVKRAPHWGVQSRFRVILYSLLHELEWNMASYFMSSVVFSRAEGECKYSLRVK